MRNLILLGLALFVVFALVKLPASTIRLVTDNVAAIHMTSLQGSVWNGRGNVIVQGHPIGSLAWSVTPARLLSARLGVTYRLTGMGAELEGDAIFGSASQRVTLEGVVSSSLINLYLRPYDLHIDGDFRLSQVDVAVIDDRVDALDGSVHWSGGDVTYILAGTRSDTRLPALVARLESTVEEATPGARVYEIDGQIPLLVIQFLRDGFVKIGVTKLLTKRLNRPWEGADPDDGVVLEVEEQLF
ncbi:MAG: type II secretion system protein N [Proteobacteria bacterium]|nr:type II secretion system protein N [Pseudomonadota bacterium]